MKVFRISILAMLALQASCSSDDGVVQDSQAQIGDRRLATVRTTFNSGRVDIISYQYDALGFPESHLLESDAVAIEKTTYFYGTNGLVDRLERDAGADGSVESSTRFYYEDGRLAIREYDDDLDQVPDLRRTTTFDTQGRYAGFEQFTLTADGQQEEQTGIVLVTYPSSSLVISERDYEPLGAPDLRVEYMVLSTGEITSSIETYFLDDESTSITEWIYEDGICDMSWQGRVYNEGCVISGID